MATKASDHNMKELLKWALAHPSFEATVAVVPVRGIMIDAARSKKGILGNVADGLPDMTARPAYVKLAVDDPIVIALKGPPERSPAIFLMVAIPTQALDRAKSPIIMPGDN